MEVKVENGPIQATRADTVIVNLFEGVTSPGGATGAVDAALDGAISDVIAAGDFRGKQGEMAVIYPRGAMPAERVIVVGLGKQESFDLEAVRLAAAAAAGRAAELGAVRVATIAHGAGIGSLPTVEAAQATLEGMLLALYRFDSFKQSDEDRGMPKSLTLVEFDADKSKLMEGAAEAAVAIAGGVALARDLVNLPPNYATPSRMADAAQEVADTFGMAITVGGGPGRPNVAWGRSWRSLRARASRRSSLFLSTTPTALTGRPSSSPARVSLLMRAACR